MAWGNAMASFDLAGTRVGIRRPAGVDCDELLALVQTSQSLHRPWVDPPSTRERYETYLKSREGPGDDGFFVCDSGSGRIVGVVNVNCTVRGLFQSAYLGYYVGAAFAGKGYMTEGVGLVRGSRLPKWGCIGWRRIFSRRTSRRLRWRQVRVSQGRVFAEVSAADGGMAGS